MIKLRKMLKNVNFNYKKSKEPIKTLWQANKYLINLRQHKLDLPKYYQKFKSLNKVVGELQQSDHGSPFIDIICRETNVVLSSLSSDEKIKLITDGEDQMVAA